ncbi:MAG: hypothetical protein WCL06_13585, partial [Bacteroidota bacterium]
FNFTNGPYTQSFEPTEYFGDWATQDVNADTYGWTMPYTGASDAHTGSNSVRLYNGGTNSGNDWLFSRCFSMLAGSTYKIDFWYKASSATYPQIVDLKVGNSNTVVAMTTTLTSLVSFANTTYQKATVNFTPSTSGTYYFGWWGHSIPNTGYAFIDDINISILPPQEATLVSIKAPNSACGLSATEPITIKIKNTGANAINGGLTAYYKINNGATFSQSVANQIVANDTLLVTFTQTANLSVTNTDQTFNIKSWIVLTGDPLTFNDTVNKSVTSFHLPASPVVINHTIPWGTSTTLHATSSDSVYWYNTPTGGQPISLAHNYTTPTLFANTVYYVEAANFNPTGPVLFSRTTNPIGNGTTTVGYPFYTFYMDSRTQMIYTASEIIAAGGGAGDIGKIILDVASADPGVMNGFTIQMQNTNLSTLTGFVSTGWTTVYSSAFTVPGTGWQEITLQNPFFYDGTSNLLINICFDNAAYTSNSTVYSTAATGKTWHQYQDLSTGSGCIDFVAGTAQTTRPNIKFNQSARGCASARVPDSVFISLFPYEASMISIPAPVSGCSYGSEHVTIRVRNNGTNTINNLAAKYSVNGGSIVTETVPTPILPNDTLTYTFTTTFNPGLSTANQDSTYHIKAFISLAGDPTQTNDTLLKTVTLLYTPPTPIVSNITIPYGSSTTLHAISTDSVFWYTVPTGGTEIAHGVNYTTPILYTNTVYYAEARTGAPDVKLTEITHYSTGTGYTNPYPAWITGADLIEISNLGSAALNLQNYTMNIYGGGARSFT